MGNLIYFAAASLDGFIEDASGGFGWAEPDEEVHEFVNELERPVGTYLYGRRMYEVMTFWDDPSHVADEPECMKDFARIWQAAEKVVYSTTLDAVTTGRTRLERSFDPDAVREMKVASDTNLAIGGAELAAQAFAAGLVDECQLLLSPVIVGKGKRALPENGQIDLELLETKSFGSGTVFLRYVPRQTPHQDQQV
jgi:dihydrofolate reductase